jgi:hypothetical protein
MKLWFACMLVFALVGSASASGKETFVNDYFEVQLWGGEYPENFTGWMNVTAQISCRNLSSEELMAKGVFPLVFDGELVNYSLAVKSMGFPELMRDTELDRDCWREFVYVPGDCHLTMRCAYQMYPLIANITIVHLLQPAHSRLPGKTLDYRSPYKNLTYGNQTIIYQGATGLYLWVERKTQNLTTMILLSVGAVLMSASVLLYVVHLRGKALLTLIGGILILTMGVLI